MSGYVVESRAQQAALVFGIVRIKATALANVERVGKDRTESRERRFVPRTLAGGRLSLATSL